ncbi:HMG box-containing protein C19G7.04 [Lasiodiplodia hormozganensis]|uniref:HMG box-containing protein C19G7.04 n=1 Tax=Lasiodiplodia hormozganensis TaxID=869390 RepID=A0AA39YCS8_9PEZI|nr:HMG box-containing protein C19G7.04 [Lasiodiplodia hormozganensis]
MARAHDESSDDELPALSDILNRRRNAQPATPSSREKNKPLLGAKYPESTAPPLSQKAKGTPVAARRQRLLKSASVDSRLARPVTAETIGSIASLDESGSTFRTRSPVAKRTAARAAKKNAKYLVDEESDSNSMAQADSDCSSESESEEDVEGSLWSASHDDRDDMFAEDDHDEATWPPNVLLPDFQKSNVGSSDDVSRSRQVSEHSVPVYETQYTRNPPPILRKPEISSVDSERPSSSSSTDFNAVLTYSPPRRRSPHKILHDSDRPCTPPLAVGPEKSRLVSPKKNRIPTPPHRPSLDAFWSAEVVNSWNDLHSPRKVLQSPKKERAGPPSDKETYQISPQKKSLAKKDPARRSFEQRKHQLARDFLDELDATITKGEISSLTAESGGVQLVWSKTLNTTAGRANWKKESIKVQENGMPSVRHKHYASIELAEKVIDDEDRLVNVIAHEFCHLTNFMISNVRDNPHGREFKEWAKRVTRAFGHRNVNVTTKHTYAIDYKYVWTCVSCEHEFKRHSKSIDPAKHRCGSCKSELVQTKPAVRRKDPNKGPNEYQIFMKENFQRIKRENEGKSHKEIMEVLGREYKEAKAQGSRPTRVEDDLKSVTRAISAVALDD